MFTTCDQCHKPIEYKEPRHTVNLYKELAHKMGEQTTIAVDQAETLLTSCISFSRYTRKGQDAR